MLLCFLQNSSSVASNKITSRVRPKGEGLVGEVVGGASGGEGSGRVRVWCPMLMWCVFYCGRSVVWRSLRMEAILSLLATAVSSSGILIHLAEMEG